MSFSLSPVVQRFVLAGDLGSVVAIPGGFKVDHWGAGRYVFLERDGVYWLGWYERLASPVFDWRAMDRVALERQLLINVGDGYRSGRQLRAIGLPYQAGQTAPGYAVVPGSQEGWSSLKRQDGSRVPFEACDSMGHPFDAVTYSYVADLPLEKIIASYRSRGGRPLFRKYLCKGVDRWS